MVEPFSNADLSEIVVNLERRLHETRMALFGTMKALSMVAKEAPLSEEAYADVKEALLAAALELNTENDNGH